MSLLMRLPAACCLRGCPDITVTVEKIGAKSVSYRFDFANQRCEPVAVGRITTVLCRHIEAGKQSR